MIEMEAVMRVRDSAENHSPFTITGFMCSAATKYESDRAVVTATET